MTPSLRYLLDTNTLSDGNKPRPNPGISARFAAHRAEVATGAPVLHEMVFGVGRLPPSSRRRSLERYLDEIVRALPILPYDAAAAEWHARERARLAALGQPPPFVDGQIAAIARANDLVLVTANVADFRAFRGIDVVDWRA